jgi:CheY-like chemotaxis protein
VTATPLVLVADPDQALRARMADLIADACGVETLPAPDGADALEQWALRAPDVLVLAPALPVIDGLTVARRARTGSTRPPVPVVFTDTVAADACRVGDVVLQRPLDLVALTAAVRNVLAARPGVV